MTNVPTPPTIDTSKKRVRFVCIADADGGCLNADMIASLAAERDALKAALIQIRDADQTDMALDPEWPSRIAARALDAKGEEK